MTECRIKLERVKRYLFLLRTFRNGLSLIQNIRQGGLLVEGPPMGEAVLWNGKRIVHPPGHTGLCGTILEVWYENTYRVGEFYKPHVGDTVLDIGAHVGLFSLLLSRYQPACRVLAVEASPNTYACLKKNLCGYANVDVFNQAIGANPGHVAVIDAKRSIDTRIVPDSECADSNTGATTVEVVTLRQLQETAAGPINLLKMDVEGAERSVFQTVDAKTLKKIDHMVVEYHDNHVPGTLAALQSRLCGTHQLTTVKDGETGHGRLFAKRKPE